MLEMNAIRYRTGKAIRWLETGAQQGKKQAEKEVSKIKPAANPKAVGENLKAAGKAVFDFGKSAWTERILDAAQGSDYILLDNALEIQTGNTAKSYFYSDITHIEKRSDRYTILAGNQTFTIKPSAYIVAGRLKVPIGWERNGVEVPFEIIIEELAARCSVHIVEL